MKKSQTTIFMVMGLVIMFVFGLVFMLQDRINELSQQREAQKIIESYFDATSFRQTVNNCLYLSTLESINQISYQGGYIYKNQPGSIVPEYLYAKEINNYNISYAITREDNQYYPCHDLADEYSYPCYYNHLKSGFYYGINNQLLHRSNNIPPLYKEFIEGFAFYFDYSYSFQEQLENTITNLTLKCANISLGQPGFFQGIDYEQPSLNLSIGSEDVNAELIFPFFVNLSKGRVTRSYDFHAEADLKLRKIWELTNRIVRRERTNVFYDINKDTFPEEFIVQKNITGTDYIITIGDKNRYLRDQPFGIRVLVEDRPPVLDCIGYCDGSPYDLIVAKNSTLKIMPFGIDPDDEEIVYRYTGWKADYDEIWPVNVSKVGTQLPLEKNLWENSTLFTEGGECEYPFDIPTPAKNRCAEISLSQNDVGPHTLTIIVSDKNNPALQNFQEIKILVDDEAVPVISNFSYFNNFTSNISSLEDPYSYDASNSQFLFETNILFTWTDLTDNFTFITNKSKTIYPSLPITQIKESTFKTLGTHNLQLNIEKTENNLSSETLYFAIDVRQCLPVRINNTAPYPYYNNQFDTYLDMFDPFTTNHICCNDDFTYADSSTTCYEYKELSCRYVPFDYADIQGGSILTESIWPGSLALRPSTPYFDDSLTLLPDRINDIYSRSYKQNCDGTRGNICNGTITDNWQHQTTCGVCEYCSWGNESCTPWEFGTVCNEQKKCVSNLSPNGYINSGPIKDYVAVGVCDGQGRCSATTGNENLSISYSNLSVAPYGVLKFDTQYIISENCNSYDIAYSENETCTIQDWTCSDKDEIKCTPIINGSINCNNYDIEPSVDLDLDTCTWVDYSINSSACSLTNFDGCSPNNPQGCCVLISKAAFSESTFDCDTLDDTDPSDNRIVESEVTQESCQFGNSLELACVVSEASCSESNLCLHFSDVAPFLDEVSDYTCVYNNTAGYTWSETVSLNETLCYDNYDNDCDGLIDCQDPDCYKQECSYENNPGICTKNNICEVSEICDLTNDLLSNCYSCGLGKTCMNQFNNLSLSPINPYEKEGICVYGLPIYCESGTVCLNQSGIYKTGCSDCSTGDFCDTKTFDGFNQNGICTQGNCCQTEFNNIVWDETTAYCGCSSPLENLACSDINAPLTTPTQNNFENVYGLYGHCQENNCCELAQPCIDDCQYETCDEDSDCQPYIKNDDTCFFGPSTNTSFGNGNGDCTGNCFCEYQNMTSENLLDSYSTFTQQTCQYGSITESYYCMSQDYCIYNCSCGDGGWNCGIDNCPLPGTNYNWSCYYDNNPIHNREDDCNIFGCDINTDTNIGFNPTLCNSSSSINEQNNFYCYQENICYFNNNDACNEHTGWESFNSEECYYPGTIENDYCWFGENYCDETGCLLNKSNLHPKDCSYHEETCPGTQCTYHYEMTGNDCNALNGWQCYNSIFDQPGLICLDYDKDQLCTEQENLYCLDSPEDLQCTNGPIMSFTLNTFRVNQDRSYAVKVINNGPPATFIISAQSSPLFAIDDLEFEIPGNTYKKVNLEQGEEAELEFQITPYTTGELDVIWEMKYDKPFSPFNILIDKKTQRITVS